MARKSRKNQKAASKLDFKVYKTAIYARLSNEGKRKEIIETQIDEVKNYIAKRKVFEIVDVYADDGFSGTNFKRPEFQRLMEDLRNGRIDCIIVKDLSRFAREHIGAEDYLNNIFPFLGVRFIAINDGYDNINIEPQEYFLASFKNYAHAYFAAETSRKVCMSKRSLQEQGKFIGTRCAYGFIKDPSDHHKLLINEPEAENIREIFNRTAAGEKISDIRDDLNSRNNPYKWTSERIYFIIKNEIYKGTLAQRKNITSFYKGEKKRSLPKDEWVRVENAVPAIVSAELWDKAQEVIALREAKRYENTPENPYKGIICCGKCEKAMQSGYRKELSDFTYICPRCKCGIFVKGKVLNRMVREKLSLSEDTEINRQLISSSFAKIVMFENKKFEFQTVGGEQL